MTRFCSPARLLILTLIFLVGCSPAARDQEIREITDDLNRPIEVPVTINRIASLAPSVTEILYTAGGGDKVVGVTTADDYPPAVDTVRRYSALPVDFESIVALEPDVVFASAQINSPQDAETLAEFGVPVFFVQTQTLEGMIMDIRSVGRLLGTSSVSDHAADSLLSLLQELTILTDSVESRPSTLFLVGASTLYAFGKGSYMHSMIAVAGGTSVTADHAMAAPTLTEEYVLTRKPEVIVTTTPAEALLSHHKTWHIIPAVRNERIYTVNPDIFVRPGPRLIEGVWEMSRLLHPDLMTQ